MKNKKSVKISARVTLADYKRLQNIRQRYGFKSVYQIINYLAYAFLRVADRDNDPIVESVPEEIEEMFADMADGDLPRKYKVKPHKDIETV